MSSNHYWVLNIAMISAVHMKLSLQSNKAATACIYTTENCSKCSKCYERGGHQRGAEGYVGFWQPGMQESVWSQSRQTVTYNRKNTMWEVGLDGASYQEVIQFGLAGLEGIGNRIRREKAAKVGRTFLMFTWWEIGLSLKVFEQVNVRIWATFIGRGICQQCDEWFGTRSNWNVGRGVSEQAFYTSSVDKN